MNNFYKCIAILLAAHSFCFAQNAATPNSDFESWTQVGNHFDPNNWNTLNPSTSILGVFTCTRASGVDAHSGSYAIKLTTKSVFGITANGIASTATIITTPPYGVSGGIPYTGRPDSIVGWYKYIAASVADSGFAEIVLQDANADTVGFARFTTPNTNVSTYTRFSRPVTYFSTNAVANSYWIITSSNGTNPVVTSALYVDDIDLIYNSNAINESNAGKNFDVINSIVTDIFKVRNNYYAVASMCIYDQAGRTVSQFHLNTGENNFNLQQLPSGIYFYQITNAQQNIFTNGKLNKL